MPEEQYFLIHISEDGDFAVEQIDDPHNIVADLEAGDLKLEDFADHLPSGDPHMWGDKKFLVIKGHIVMPKPVTQITQYELP